MNPWHLLFYVIVGASFLSIVIHETMFIVYPNHMNGDFRTRQEIQAEATPRAAEPEPKEDVLAKCTTITDQAIKNFCYRDAAMKLRDEKICELILEEFTDLSDEERANMDANVSIKMDCVRGVDIAKYFSPENCAQIVDEREKKNCYDGIPKQ